MDRPDESESTDNDEENASVVTAEHIFTGTAFNILDENALFIILAKLSPISIIALCQSNRQLARLCSKPQTFISLMDLHYPQYPVDIEDPKRQYIDITGGIGVIYSVDILGYRKLIRDSRGNDIFVGYEFDNKAYADPEGVVHNLDTIPFDARTKISFTILGTKIRRGEKLWLTIEQSGKHLIYEVYPSKEKAVRSMYIVSTKNGGKRENTLYRHIFEDLERQFIHKTRFNYVYWNTRPVITTNEPVFSAFTEETNYPFPFTLEGIYDYIMLNNFFNARASRIRERPDIYEALLNPEFKTHEGDDMLSEMENELHELHVFQVIPITIV